MLDTYRLLLVGRTGNGKSSTGNTILGEKKFTVHGVNDSTDHDGMEKHSGIITEHLVEIIDGTGIGDSGETGENDVDLFKSIEDKAFSDEVQAKSLTAIILVLKFGVRFTKQERASVEHVKLLLGDDVFEKCGVIVMTYGDNFVKDQTGGFKAWCRNQAGDFKNIFEECRERCVLFNNRCQTQSETREQLVDELLQIIKNIGIINSYTDKDFKVSKRGHILNAFNRSFKIYEERTEQIEALHKNKRKNAAIKLHDKVSTLKGDLAELNLTGQITENLSKDIDSLLEKIEPLKHRHKTYFKVKKLLHIDRTNGNQGTSQIDKCNEKERGKKKRKRK